MIKMCKNIRSKSPTCNKDFYNSLSKDVYLIIIDSIGSEWTVFIRIVTSS